MRITSVVAFGACESSYIDNGVDVSFRATWEDGSVLEGEVTFRKREGRFRAWGPAPDYWLDNRSVHEVSNHTDSRDDFRACLDAIEEATSEAAHDLF